MLATETAGIASLVTPGRNGYLLDPDTAGAKYADVVAQVWSHPTAYRSLSESAHAEYRSRLNWTSAAERVVELLRRL